MKVIITVNIISQIGGIETWLYNLAHQMYQEYDVLILYEKGDPKQLERLAQYVNIGKMKRFEKYTCDVCIIGSTITPYYNNIKATRYIQVVHADFHHISKQFFMERPIPNIEYVTVSKNAYEGLLDTFGIQSVILENPMDIYEPPKKILHLLSCTRLSHEKGYGRMIQLTRIMRENSIPFEWKIYSDFESYGQEKIPGVEFIYMDPQLDLRNQIADADYGVQLSDTESFGYFIHECLQYRTPVLVTDLPCLQDINFIDEVHGYILNFDMTNVDIEKIYRKIPKCDVPIVEPGSYEKWKAFLGHSDVSTTPQPLVKIKVTKRYLDMQLGKEVLPGYEMSVPCYRADELCDNYQFAIRML